MKQIIILGLLASISHLHGLDEVFIQAQRDKLNTAFNRFSPEQQRKLEDAADPKSDYNKIASMIQEGIGSQACLPLLEKIFTVDRLPIDFDHYNLHGTALHYACWVGNEPAATMLIGLKANVNHNKGRRGDTPLLIVLESYLYSLNNRPDGEPRANQDALKAIFKKLLDAGADSKLKNHLDTSAKDLMKKEKKHLSEFKAILKSKK